MIKTLYAWAFLIIAVILEIIGLSTFGFIKDPVISKIILVCFICASYFVFSKSLNSISVGVAYSVWEILGIIGILFVSFAFFEVELSTQEIIGIAVGLVGIICVVLGEKH